VNFLLDTNAVSEWVKPVPNPGLIQWMQSVDEDRVFLSVIALAELNYGIERMSPGSGRSRLEHWLQQELVVRFERRILPVDEETAVAWGRTMSRSEAIGKPMSTVDAFLSATAEVHELTLVTRNARHFPLLKSLISPWS